MACNFQILQLRLWNRGFVITTALLFAVAVRGQFDNIAGDDIVAAMQQLSDKCPATAANGQKWAPLPRGTSCGSVQRCKFPDQWCAFKDNGDGSPDMKSLNCQPLSDSCKKTFTDAAGSNGDTTSTTGASADTSTTTSISSTTSSTSSSTTSSTSASTTSTISASTARTTSASTARTTSASTASTTSASTTSTTSASSTSPTSTTSTSSTGSTSTSSTSGSTTSPTSEPTTSANNVSTTTSETTAGTTTETTSTSETTTTVAETTTAENNTTTAEESSSVATTVETTTESGGNSEAAETTATGAEGASTPGGESGGGGESGSGAGGGCCDYHEFCCFWASQGECDRNAKFMIRICQKSCGTCGCQGWSSCAVNVASKCHGSDVRPGEACPCKSGHPVDKDWSKECPTWAAAGDCDKNADFMKPMCKRSCKICNS